MQTKKTKLLWLLWLIPIALLLIGLYFLLKRAGILQLFESADALRSAIRSCGVWAPLLFILLQILQVIFAPIPGNITTLAGGVLFGFWPAILYSTVAIFTGSMIAFAIGRILGKPVVIRFVSPEIVEKYLVVLAGRQRLTLALLFLFPFFPDDLLCFVAGLTRYSWKWFAVMVLFTRPWGLIFSALIGSGALQMPVWGWILILLFAGFALFFSIRYGEKIENALLKKFRIHMDT